jgi:hypothetical protein
MNENNSGFIRRNLVIPNSIEIVSIGATKYIIRKELLIDESNVFFIMVKSGSCAK